MLRHSAVTNLYALTKDIRLTQRFARHRSLVTTVKKHLEVIQFQALGIDPGMHRELIHP